MARAEVDAGQRLGLSGDERAELVRLRRENRVQAMEIEILKRAGAYFARKIFHCPRCKQVVDLDLTECTACGSRLEPS